MDHVDRVPPRKVDQVHLPSKESDGSPPSTLYDRNLNKSVFVEKQPENDS
jgi:hypothetical protein